MRRREFLGFVGCAGAWSLDAHAQQAVPVVGFLNSGWSGAPYPPLSAFLKGLGEAGFVERTNVAIEYAGQRDTMNACLHSSPISSGAR